LHAYLAHIFCGVCGIWIALGPIRQTAQNEADLAVETYLTSLNAAGIAVHLVRIDGTWRVESAMIRWVS